MALAAIAVAPVAAHAADKDWYFGAGGTVSLRGTEAGTIANAPPGQTLRIENYFDPGLGGYFALGRDFGLIRVEGELGYTRDTSDRYAAISPPLGEIFGQVESETLRTMANAFVDFKLGGLEPYVGAGVGYAWSDLLSIAPRAFFPTEQPRRLIDDSDSGFAYQAMAGIAVPVNERLRLTFGYRWFDEGRFVGVDARNEEIASTRGVHNIDVGLRWSF